MGAIGFMYHGTKAIYGMAIKDRNLIDESINKGKYSISRTILDPIGIMDAIDIITDSIGNQTLKI